MTDPDENIIRLIREDVAGVLSETGREELDGWLNESVEHRKLLAKIKKELRVSSEMPLFCSLNNSKATEQWREILAKNQKVRIKIHMYRVIGYAAVVLLSFCAGIYFWMRLGEDVLPMARENVFGNNVVELMLANGRIVDLMQERGTIREEQGIVIQNTGNRLTYHDSCRVISDSLVYNRVRVPKSGDYQLKLSDGTIVYLNSMTTLRFPERFSGDSRRVELNGEAYFKVAKDTACPFIVVLNGMEVKVLGTSFNISSYPDDHFIKVTLVEGSVAALSENLDVRLKPEQQLYYNKTDRQAGVREVNTTDYTSWKNGYFVFKHSTLADVAKTIDRWYNIEVVFRREADAGTVYTGVIYKDEGVEGLMKRLKSIADVNSELIGGKLYIE